MGMVTKCRELAEANGWFMARQFENPANADIHERTTAREIMDAFAEAGVDAREAASLDEALWRKLCWMYNDCFLITFSISFLLAICPDGCVSWLSGSLVGRLRPATPRLCMGTC